MPKGKKGGKKGKKGKGGGDYDGTGDFPNNTNQDLQKYRADSASLQTVLVEKIAAQGLARHAEKEAQVMFSLAYTAPRSPPIPSSPPPPFRRPSTPRRSIARRSRRPTKRVSTWLAPVNSKHDKKSLCSASTPGNPRQRH